MTQKLLPKARNQSARHTQEHQDILMNAPIGIFTSTQNGRIIEANQTMAVVFGYESPREMIDAVEDIGQQIYADFEDREEIIRYLEKHDERLNYKCRFVRRDGSQFWASINIKAVWDEQGNIIHYQGFFLDITELKRVEEVLRKSEKKYRLLAEGMMDIIWTLDLNFRTTYVSPSIMKVLGFTTEERIRQEAADIMTPESYARIVDALAREMRTEQEVNADPDRSLTIEIEYYHKKGHTVWMENLVRGIRERDGNLVGIHGVSRDITERKRSEKSLRKHVTRFQKLSSHVPGMLYQFMKKTDGTYCMPLSTEAIKDIFGCSPQDVREDFSPIARVILPEDLDEVIDSIESSAEHMTTWRCKYRVRIPGRPVRWMFGQSTPEKLADGSILWHGFNTDITEQKRTDEELKEGFTRLRKALGSIVQAVAVTVEKRDPYTAGHQRRVADLARSIATEMDLPQDQIEGIRMAGIIHDLGKISVPSEILSKPTRLKDIEFSLIKTHSQSGYDILKDIDFPWPIARMVLEHHERMDGSGYPKGLTGDKLLIESRILTVADVVEAMSSHRPYRATLGIDTALEEIEKNKGTLYEADAVDACLRLFREKGFQLNSGGKD